MTIKLRHLILCSFFALALAAPASADCLHGRRSNDEGTLNVNWQNGETTAAASGGLSQARPTFCIEFIGYPGQTLTLQSLRDPGINWTGGAPITFPGGTDGNAIFPGRPLTLPTAGVYIIGLRANTSASHPYGPFFLKLTLVPPATQPRR